MIFPTETHRLYVTLDDETLYQVHEDFSKTEVDKKEVLTKDFLLYDRLNQKPVILLHKNQFDELKIFGLNKENPLRMNRELVEFYFKLGFLTKEELEEYLEDGSNVVVNTTESEANEV